MYVSIYLAICLPGYLTTYLSVYMPLCLSVYLSTYLFISLSLYLSICPSIYLFLKERNSARIPSNVEGDRSKTKQFRKTPPQKQEAGSSKTKKFCEPSTFELDDVKNEAILRGYLQKIKR